MPFISIFIPAYKNVLFLKRLLDSIVDQNYSDFEVIITDDSPNNEVEILVQSYLIHNRNWKYFKNKPPLGMPQNWNYGLSLCIGEWVKIMHDDDWFAKKNSLTEFANATKLTMSDFIFSAYCNIVNQDIDTKKIVKISDYRRNELSKEPMVLLSDNVIGPPSVTLVRNGKDVDYDNRLKWRVDIDYYINLLFKKADFYYIDQPLINVGLSSDQVTNEVKNNKSVEIPEAHILLEKYGTQSFQNILVYDSWWRFFRNLNLFNIEELSAFLPNQKWPNIVKKLIKDLNRFKLISQKSRILSKTCMTISYLKNRSKTDA